MPVSARLEGLTTTAELVWTAAQLRGANPARPVQTAIKNVDAAITVYVGPSTVTSAGANGMEILAGTTFTYDATSVDEQVYMVAASGTPNVRIIGIGPIES